MGVIIVNRNADEVEPTLIREDDGVSQYLYGGFDIELFKDDLESYTATFVPTNRVCLLSVSTMTKSMRSRPWL